MQMSSAPALSSLPKQPALQGGAGAALAAGAQTSPSLQGEPMPTDQFQAAPASERPVPAGPLHFPSDEGAHPGVKTEWFYLNGHLADDQGHRFALMDCLFDVPDAFNARYNVDLPGRLGATQLHSALLDCLTGEHQAFTSLHLKVPFGGKQHLEAGHLDESFVSDQGEFRIQRIDDSHLHLEAPCADGHVSLNLTQLKPALLMGGAGEIPMGPDGLSKYYTLPLLQAEGTVTSHGETHQVHGNVWMDHQWGDMSMFRGYDGWDWFGVQTSDGTELNLFNFRDAAGHTVQANAGISRPDGTQVHATDLHVEPLQTWDSPHTGRRYATAWHVTVPSQHIDLTVRADHQDQEMLGTGFHHWRGTELIPTYWEGETAVSGSINGKTVSGDAFLEITGASRHNPLLPEPAPTQAAAPTTAAS